jgi:hypothetical protein
VHRLDSLAVGQKLGLINDRRICGLASGSGRQRCELVGIQTLGNAFDIIPKIRNRLLEPIDLAGGLIGLLDQRRQSLGILERVDLSAGAGRGHRMSRLTALHQRDGQQEQAESTESFHRKILSKSHNAQGRNGVVRGAVGFVENGHSILTPAIAPRVPDPRSEPTIGQNDGINRSDFMPPVVQPDCNGPQAEQFRHHVVKRLGPKFGPLGDTMPHSSRLGLVIVVGLVDGVGWPILDRAGSMLSQMPHSLTAPSAFVAKVVDLAGDLAQL